jgi:hypothetical protein
MQPSRRRFWPNFFWLLNLCYGVAGITIVAIHGPPPYPWGAATIIFVLLIGANVAAGILGDVFQWPLRFALALFLINFDTLLPSMTSSLQDRVWAMFQPAFFGVTGYLIGSFYDFVARVQLEEARRAEPISSDSPLT